MKTIVQFNHETKHVETIFETSWGYRSTCRKRAIAREALEKFKETYEKKIPASFDAYSFACWILENHEMVSKFIEDS